MSFPSSSVPCAHPSADHLVRSTAVTVNALGPVFLSNPIILSDQDLLYFDQSMWPITPGTGRNVPGTFVVSHVHQETLVVGRGSAVATLRGCARARNKRARVLNGCLVRRRPLLCLGWRSICASYSSSWCLITARWVTSTQFFIIRFSFRSGYLFTGASSLYIQLMTKCVMFSNKCSRVSWM